jgi:RNA recognition motif-containing protein
MNIYISNLDSQFKDEDLKILFSSYGEVESAEIAKDVFTDQSRGFGYVEMPNEEEAQKAITGIDKSEVKGLTVNVQEAQPKVVHKGSYKVGSGAVNVYRFKKN